MLPRITLRYSDEASETTFLVNPHKTLNDLKQEAYDALHPRGSRIIDPAEYHFYTKDGTELTSIAQFKDGDQICLMRSTSALFVKGVELL